MSAQKGIFITFEGGEGSGKTTQINTLSKALTDQGYKVITSREPGGTAEGESVRNLLVQRDGGNWSPMAECLLLYAARVMHVEKVIKPALETGKIVICDRFSDSTKAYQGYGHGLALEQIDEIDKTSLKGFKPDLTFIFDIDAKDGLMRSRKQLESTASQFERTEDRFENLDIEFHEKLHQGFLTIAKQNPDRCSVIDARENIDSIASIIQKIALEKIEAL